jgi:hypothetical protein
MRLPRIGRMRSYLVVLLWRFDIFGEEFYGVQADF